MDRRIFIRAAALGAGVFATAKIFRRALAGEATRPDLPGRPAAGPHHATAAGSDLRTERQGEMIYRMLGRTGERVSAIGMGGHHIGITPDDAEGIRLIRAAIDRGITFMDNSWDYHNGGSEERMGRALKDGYRDKVFLMTKVDGRTREAAARQIEESLRRLQTDRIDLIQHHEIIRFEDPDRIFAEGGAQEAVLAAQRAGKIRYVGFTGHKDPAIHLRMIEVARQHGFHFDTVQMPVNVMDAHFRSFGRQVAPVAASEGIAVLGMKPMAAGEILQSRTVSAVECLQFALSQPSAVVITGIENERDLEQVFAVVRDFRPLSEAETVALLARTALAASMGKFEKFKTTSSYDATAHHPEWLG